MRAEQHRLSRGLMPQKSNSKLMEQYVQECRPSAKQSIADESASFKDVKTRMPADKEGDSADGWWMSWSRPASRCHGCQIFWASWGGSLDGGANPNHTEPGEGG